MILGNRQFGTILVGGGPAGLAVLLAAHKDGRLTEMLRQGLLIVERDATIGVGQIGGYAINSDSTGDTFLDPLRTGSESRLHAILESPVGRRIAAAGPNAIPLQDAGELMRLVGEALHALIQTFAQSAVMTESTAQMAQRQRDGSWLLSLRDAQGRLLHVEARSLILATGATQPWLRLEGEMFAGVSLLPRWGDRLMQSGEVLREGGMDKVAARLSGKVDPKIAVLGGSTSAMAVAHALLHRLPSVSFRPHSVTVLHRRPFRVYYTTAEEALQDGYTEFGPGDLCPITQRVYRFAGLRLDSRELLMQALGIGNRPPEPRLRLHALQPHDPVAVQRIDDADLVIAALGYRPNALPLRSFDGKEIVLRAHTGPSAPLVDGQCRVIDRHGRPVEGVYGIGLAAGFVPRGPLGGEPSFSGQANGLWLWQHDVGLIVVQAILSTEQETRTTFSSITTVTGRLSERRVSSNDSAQSSSFATGTRA